MIKNFIFLLSAVFHFIFAVAFAEEKLHLSFIDWDVYMLGIDTPEKAEEIRKSVKRIPVIALVSFSGVNEDTIKNGIEYVSGPFKSRGMHDTYQIYEVVEIAKKLGVSLKIKVYTAENTEQLAEGFRQAGKNADIVIVYSSIWQDPSPFHESISENPNTLYISPYVEVGEYRTVNSFQGGARHPDGTGLRNFITTIPLSRYNPSGKLLSPSCRDKDDTETVTVAVPSSYASSFGETCPSAGVTAAVAAYIASTSEAKIPAEQIIKTILKNTSFPEKRMLKLKDFDSEAVEMLRKSLKTLTAPDAVGIRRLESDGILDIWKIHQSLSGVSD